MSTTAQSPLGESDREILEHLVRNKPLAHPLTLAIRESEVFGHEQSPPPHVREIYGAIHRAFSDNHPDAPKTLARIEPRGHAKSESGSGVTPVWKALQDPNVRILIMMLNTEEAKGKLQKCKGYLEALAPKYGHNIIESNKTRLTLERDADHAEPTIRAAGFDTGVTGGRYDYIIFDDIVDQAAQRTAHRRKTIEEDFLAHLRLRASDETVFLTLGTRKHSKDIYQNLIDAGGWNTTVEQAIEDWSIVENGEYDLITIDDETGQRRRYNASEIGARGPNETIIEADPHRQCPVLWPERWPLDELLLDLHTGFGRDESRLVWKREMQNDASALTGAVLSSDMLHWTAALPGRQSDYVRYAGLDLATEKDPEKAASNNTDYFALSIYAQDISTEAIYLEDMARKRGMTLTQALEWVDGHLSDYNRVVKCLVESNQAQSWFTQQGREKHGLPLETSHSSGNKEDRIISMSPMFESGDVKIVDPLRKRGKQLPIWDGFEDEFVAFPSADHDDMLDAAEIGLRNFSDDEGGQKKETRVYSIGF
ncbi:hypothetical protein [Halalkalicoccus jeotgali]|uniref:Terminase large subunit gp17-like C-terminal domain-containing protein n=1 Tax=Halalkalicoccus jeotgali (strain DSM 18796 / CECT 7217 / JCM 14584 / KCTC 4019 / B3) TaxID=795797 RepID=D8J9W6_HALJB|nr:hypothetical protein [Halalkalicoccus jeotgali]ADJ14488.1 hypothetical protein HacjB3_05485 [Halalkalicoccus jeotgali B3]ELY40202.1 hypothetical protein C497_03860 [Halalkalicoccus jeotgali B3]